MRDSLPSARYSPVCNVLRQWKTSLIPIESTDSMILILQWTYRDSVVSSDARLHVNPIHFLARRAVCQQLFGDSTQSKSKFHHQTYSKLTSTTPFSYTESAGNVSPTSFGTSHVEVSGRACAPSTHVRRS